MGPFQPPRITDNKWRRRFDLVRQYIINTLTGSAVALIASAAARAMPEPAANGSQLYRWFYRFAHFALANFDKTRVTNGNQPSGN
jgi:hypothetical protein